MTFIEKIALSVLGIKEKDLDFNREKVDEPIIRKDALEPLSTTEETVLTPTPDFEFKDEDEIDLSFEIDESLNCNKVSLSLLGEQVQKTLTRWGQIGKTNIEATIILEDSKSTKGQSIFYFDYSENIAPSDFYNFALKDNSKMLQNIEADIICDAVKISKAGISNQNRAMIVVLNGRT